MKKLLMIILLMILGGCQEQQSQVQGPSLLDEAWRAIRAKWLGPNPQYWQEKNARKQYEED